MEIPDENKFNYLLDKDDVYVFTKAKYFRCEIDNSSIPDDVKYVYDLELNCLNINSKINKKLIEIKNGYVEEWHTQRGCFQYSHYKAIELNSCISEFIL